MAAGECSPMAGLLVESGPRLRVDRVETVQVIRDLALSMLDVPTQALCAGNVLRAGDRSHLRAVERDHSAADQALAAAELNEGGAGAHDGLGIVVPERCDRPVIRRKTTHEPEGFKIPDAGPLQHPRRAHLVEVAPDIKPQHVRGPEPRSAGRRGHCAIESEFPQVETLDKGINDTHQ